MELSEIINLYFKHLKSANLEKILPLFADTAIIHYPGYGEMEVTAFFTKYFEDTEKSNIKIINVYEICDVLSAAAYYKNKWAKKDGTTTSFEGVNIFNFDKFMKIEHLKVIYSEDSKK